MANNMMDAVRKTADFSENQTKFLLKDLNSPNHSNRLKGVRRYQEYIQSNRPDMYEDVVDMLYLGNEEYDGLITWCGSSSSKHAGQLKRIAADVITLIKYLITLEPDEYGENVFFDRFIRIPVKNLRDLNLSKHITASGSSFFSSNRSGSSSDAFEILSIIMEYHCNDEGDLDPVDINYLLNDNVQSLEAFRSWLRHSAAEELKLTATTRKKVKVVARPTKWSEVRLKCVPLQPDEEGFGNEEDLVVDDISPIVPDPLGLSSVDLRSLQAAHITSAITEPEEEPQQSSTSGARRKKRHRASTISALQRIGLMKIVQESIEHTHVQSGDAPLQKISEDEDDFDIDMENDSKLPIRKRHSNVIQVDEQVPSLLPSDKNFQPDLFLSIVHGTCNKNDLSKGLANLQGRLTQQSSRREDLVRQHYGLFIHCVDGLEWLKAFHEKTGSIPIDELLCFYLQLARDKDQESPKPITPARNKSVTSGILSNKKIPALPSRANFDVDDEHFDNPMRKALQYLAKAKDEAQNTLAPILSRMQRAKQLKNADQILRRLLSTLEYPYAMQQMLAAGDFQSVLTIYRRVQSLPVASGLRIVKRIVNRSDIIMFEMKQKIMSILLNPTPVLPVLGKLVKILHEMEDEENCRLILQQCYERQIQTFEDQIKNIVNKSCEEFMRAYMRGQEINLMNKDPTLRGVAGSGGTNSPKATTKKNNNTTNQTYLTNESNPPVRRKTAASIRFAATKRRQSQTNDTLNDAVRSLYDGLNDSLFDDEQQSGISSFDDYNGRDYQDNNDEDGDYDEMDELSDSGSVVSSGSGNSKGIYLKKSDEDGMYQDPHTDYSEYFCKKVRIKLTRQLIDAIDMWLPSVHRLLILLTSAPQQSAPPVKITATAATTTISSRKVSVALPNRALQTTYGRNQSVANQAKQLGDVLVACAEAIRGSILGFKGKYLSSYMNEMISKSIFSQDFMQNTLKEPHLSATVMEISEVYDVIETVLMDSNRTETTPNTNTFMNDDLDSVNFFGSTAYRDSIHMLRALAEDGENTIAKKTMEQLLAQALVLTSKATNKSDLMDLNSRGKSYFLEEDGLNGDDNKSKTIDDIVRQFELMTIKRLRRLVEVIRRPDWVATTVWDYIQRLFDRFISSLAMVAGASNDGKKGFERNDTFDESDIEQAKIRMSLQLEMLELSLMDTQHVQLTKIQSLDFIRACVRLRTQTVSNLWNETKNLFPLESTKKEETTPTPASDIRRKSRTGLSLIEDPESMLSPAGRRQLGGDRLKTIDKTIDDRISLSVGSISVMEENAVVKYLDTMLLYFRTIIHSSYSVLVKAEMGSTYDKLRYSSRALPSHLSRILLELEYIQAELIRKLAGLTVASTIGQQKLNGGSKLFADADVRSWVTDKTSYQEFLFHIICISVLDVYATLVESLTLNAFSLHSTGRKPISRRLSSVNKQNSMDENDDPKPGLTGGGGSSSSRRLDASSGVPCKYLLSCSQALEEFDFLLMALRPLVLSETEIPVVSCRENLERQIQQRKEELNIISRKTQLWQEARLFVEAVRNKSSGRYIQK